MEGQPRRCLACNQPLRCVTCLQPLVGGGGGGGGVRGQGVRDLDPSFVASVRRLVAEDFSRACAADSACRACGADFCAHCCGDHHRGHDGALAIAAATAAADADREERSSYRRDSFCVGCGAAFCSQLCAHHAGEGHQVMRVDEYGGSHFVRCTGAEPWFHTLFGGIQTFEDKDGNLMIPLQRRRTPSLIPEPGLKFRTR